MKIIEDSRTSVKLELNESEKKEFISIMECIMLHYTEEMAYLTVRIMGNMGVAMHDLNMLTKYLINAEYNIPSNRKKDVYKFRVELKKQIRAYVKDSQAQRQLQTNRKRS